MSLTPDTELTLRQAAELCGCSEKTIDRRIRAGLLESRKDGGRVTVTVAGLVAIGMYILGAESAAEVSRAARLEYELARVVAERTAMESELRVVRAQLAEMRRINDQYFKLLSVRDKVLTSVLKEAS